MEQDEAPKIAALFLVIFDQKVGYSIAWKQSIPNIDLDGVEFKSLPSGLHAVRNDLVYFVHDAYAGVSAFVKGEASASERNANFVAVGALVPLSYGRLGRGWLHAQELRKLGAQMVKSSEDKSPLEAFWKKVGQSKSDAPRRESLGVGKRKRALSDATLGVKGGKNVKDIPALSAPALLDLFGPLLFPLYRAALLRKRILLLGTPPVQPNCDYVYLLSVLSSIPHALDEALQRDADPLLRIQALFSVGIHDIPALSDNKGKSGWLACTTDDILGEKQQLYDFCVEIPAIEKRTGPRRQWPKIRSSDGTIIKATQRDLRRYRLLRREINRLQRSHDRFRDDEDAIDDNDTDETPLISMNPGQFREAGELREGDDEGEVVEPLTWSAMAYNGFMWWASAGEQMEWEEGEAFADYQLLSDLPDIYETMTPSSPGTASRSGESMEAQGAATILTAYFHRFTTLIIQTLADIVEHADDNTEEGVKEDAIEITTDDVQQMGLHTWSIGDREFVTEAMKLYFGREAIVADNAVRMCGVKIC